MAVTLGAMTPTTFDKAAHQAVEMFNLHKQMGSAALLGASFEEMQAAFADGAVGEHMWLAVYWLANDAWAATQQGHGSFAVADLVIRKHHGYGPGNIDAFGEFGIIVRISDKLARYDNLLKGGTDRVGESILETLLDVVGYCVIWKMRMEGWWSLPLKGDDLVIAIKEAYGETMTEREAQGVADQLEAEDVACDELHALADLAATASTLPQRSIWRSYADMALADQLDTDGRMDYDPSSAELVDAVWGFAEIETSIRFLDALNRWTLGGQQNVVDAAAELGVTVELVTE